MTGDFIDAQRAREIGLYHRVVPQAQVLSAARALAERLAPGPSAALTVTKDSLNREAAMELAAALELEAQLQAELMRHPNFRESFEAFRAKREPTFT